MRRFPSRAIALLLPCCLFAFLPAVSIPVPASPADPDSTAPAETAASAGAVPGGELRAVDGRGGIRLLPLKHTEVRAEITGDVARVRVSQVFQNPSDHAIEAVYVFPLPRSAAVDDMEIRIGDRVIRGVVKKREEARAAYEQARRSGRTAALLDQERPNIFTQSVANILPGEEVVVGIRFFDVLPCNSGVYEFAFPMVVAPRFVPGASAGGGEPGASPDAARVPDASRISPPVLEPGERSGRDISLEVEIRAGGLLHDLESPSHAVEVDHPASGGARVRLRGEDSISNKDFLLRYRLDGDAPEVALLPHRTGGAGYFLMLIQPELKPSRDRVEPKEMIFVVDCSGSMSGAPIEKVREAMSYALENLNPLDNFQILRFSDQVEAFAPEPVPATPAHIAPALEYVAGLSGEGGTILLDGVKAALGYPEDPQRLRIISFMTDGDIGNEEEILAYLRGHLGAARLFSFGVGSSPNRYLLDKMAELGRGAVTYIPPGGKASDSVRGFYDRIRSPYLTDLEVDWNGLPVSGIYPARIPDLFLGQPVALYGRYDRPAVGEISLRGRLGGQPYEKRLKVDLPEQGTEGGAVASLWARSKIEDLSGRLAGDPQPDLVEAITGVALSHHLVSAFTSFVAVEEWPRTEPVEPERVQVPVPMPEGMSFEKVFGDPSRPGPVQTIRVQGTPVVVSTASAASVSTASFEYVFGLPVLGRDYQDVLTLAPGVTDVNDSGNPNLHGARDTGVVTLADGAAAAFGGNLDAASLQDIRIVTAGASAEYSRAQGGFVNIVTGPRNGAFRGAGALPTFCRLAAVRGSYRVGDTIELYVAVRNLSQKIVKVPTSLSVAGGTALFRILDASWDPLPDPVPARKVRSRRSLFPGEWIVYKVVLNGEGGYRIPRPGLYYLVFLGSELGLPDSTQLTLRIEP